MQAMQACGASKQRHRRRLASPRFYPSSPSPACALKEETLGGLLILSRALCIRRAYSSSLCVNGCACLQQQHGALVSAYRCRCFGQRVACCASIAQYTSHHRGAIALSQGQASLRYFHRTDGLFAEHALRQSSDDRRSLYSGSARQSSLGQSPSIICESVAS